MKEYIKRKKFKKILYSKLSIALFALLLFFTARASFHLYLKQNESQRNEEKAKAELSLLQSRQNFLEDEINRLNTASGIEEEIRDKFSVVKENENMVVIKNEEINEIIPEVKASFLKDIEMKIRSFFRGGE